jgi:DnaK suppressor protein
MATKTKAQQETDIKMEKKPSVGGEQASKAKAVSKGTRKSIDKVAQTLPAEDVGAATRTAAKLKDKSAGVSADSKPELQPATSEKQHSATVIEKAPEQVAVQTKSPKWLEIKVILTAIKEDTLREISKTVKNGTDAAATIEPGGDIYDQASSERDRELGLLLGDREREKLHNIDDALLRIDEGEYGICEECDEDIPLGRLKAMPFTRHCVKCKSDLEKLQAQTRRVEEERAYREIPLGADEDEA